MRIRNLIVLLLIAAPAVAGDEPAWVAKVPDFRSAWPEPPATGTAAPDFTLPDLTGARHVNLKKTEKDRKATLLLFIDTHCRTCRDRAADLAASVEKAHAIDGVAALVIFPKNSEPKGPKGAAGYAKDAKFPDVPLLYDEKDGAAEVTIEYRVMVTPCAVVLDDQGRIAYYGLALGRSGADLVPKIVAAAAAKTALPGPAYRPPYG